MYRVNVGGVVFVTTKSTLCRSPYFRCATQNAEACGDDSLFVDRDPTTFRFVLNYLRGSSVLPRSIELLEELSIEADFFSLTELRDLVVSKVREMHDQSLEQSLVDLRSILRGT